MATSKKYDLIRVTYEMLKTSSPERLKIRDIAAAAQCTSAVIYRHFDNLDHLLLISSVRFLEDYIIELQDTTNQSTDPLTVEINMWQAFAKHAFKNLDIFELFFWGRYKEHLSDTIYEYYQMFPEQWTRLNGLYTIVFFNNDLKERNRTILTQAANAGYFKTEDVPLLADLQCDLFHGMLLDHKDTYRLAGVPEQAAARFMEILFSLHEHYRLK